MRDFKEIRVAVAGTGYVGLSIATLLSQHHHVTAVDVIPEKVEKLNNKVSLFRMIILRSIWLKSRLTLLPLWTGDQPTLTPTLW